MKIATMYASNVKRLKLVNLKFDGKSFVVSGLNEQGKSSFIDAFHYLFKGKKAIPTEVIRKGEDRIEIYADLTEDFRIERIITKDKIELYVKPLDDASNKIRYGSPQDICNKLFGDLTFDPLEFYNKKAQEQVEILKQFLPDKKHLDEIEQSIILKYNYRTDVNKEFKKNELTFNSMKQPNLNLPNTEISVAQLSKDKEAMERNRDHYHDRIKDRDYLIEEIKLLKVKLANNQLIQVTANTLQNILLKIPVELQKVSELEQIKYHVNVALTNSHERIDNYTSSLSTKESELKEITVPKKEDWDVKIAKLREQIETAEETNRAIRYRNDYAKAENAAGDAKIKSDQLTMELEELRSRKKKLFDEANLPVPGLTFGEEGIQYESIPYDNLSTSKKLFISMLIGMALNPKLQTMFTKHANDFDEERLKEIFKLAEKHDYQLIVERINPVEGIPYIVIENGLLKEDHINKPEGEVI